MEGDHEVVFDGLAEAQIEGDVVLKKVVDGFPIHPLWGRGQAQEKLGMEVMKDVLIGFRRGVVDFVDDDVIEGLGIEFPEVEVQHRSGREDEVRVDSPIPGLPGVKAVGAGCFEDGLKSFLGTGENRVFMNDEKQALRVEVLRVESRQEGFP